MLFVHATALLSLQLLISPARAVADTDEGVSSLEKLIEMLEEMTEKGKAEMQDEEVQFTKYKTWWEGTEKSLKASIADAKSNEETLSASVTKLREEVEQLGADIGEANGKTDDTEKTKEEATKKRAGEHKEFEAQEKNLSESLDSLERAITVLKEEPSKVGQAGAVLLQLSESQHLSDDTQAAFKSFLEELNDDSSQAEAPQASAYENQSGGILDMLTSMMETFRKNLNDLQTEEANQKQSYDLLIGDLVNELAVLKRTTEDLTSEKAEKTEKAAADDKELTSTVDSRTADEESLKQGSTTWDEKKSAFDANQKTRQDEITAINQAKSVLEGEAVSTGKEHLKLTQTASAAVALLQIKEGTSSARVRVRDFISKKAGELHSHFLMLLADKLAADPFAKVKGLLQDMIEKLVEEADKDSDKNAFCTTELGKSKITRTALSEKIEGMTAKVENLKSEITMFGEAVSKLTSEVTTMESDKTEAVEQWNETKASLELAITDAKAAQTAVASAIKTLQDFYSNASDSSQSYKGSDASTGVLALFEVVQSDFAKVEADSTASLTSGTKEHEDMLTEFDKNHAVKTKSIEMNKDSKLSAEVTLNEVGKDLEEAQIKLTAKDKFHEELVQSCFEKGETYEDKAKAREDEIEALKQALQLLSN